MIQFDQLPSSRKLLRTLLESTPDNLCYDEVHETLSKVIRQPSRAVCVYLIIDNQVRGVVGVHSLHLWSLSAPVVCLTVHLTTKVKYTYVSFKFYLKLGCLSREKTWRGFGQELRLWSGPSTRSKNNHSGEN